MIDGAACAEGRRPKASKGGNRAGGTCGGRTGAMGIWAPPGRCASCGTSSARI